MTRYHGVILHEWTEGRTDEVWVCEHKHHSADDAKDCAKQQAASVGGLNSRESVIAVRVGEPRQGIRCGPDVSRAEHQAWIERLRHAMPVDEDR